LVNCVSFRNPVHLARLAADVDRLSNGRLVLGLGIGDAPSDFAQLGIPCLPVPVRQRMLDEVVQIVKGLWRSKSIAIRGEFFRLDEAAITTYPMQEPYVPLLIAGGGEKVTLRQVAHYADMANFGAHATVGGAFDLEDVDRKLAALSAHLAAAGRPVNAILRSHWSGPVVVAETPARAQSKWEALPAWMQSSFASSAIVGTPNEVVDRYRPLIRAGMSYLIAAVVGTDVETVRLLGQQVLPAVAAE
jgi:alkanesulfonate monooxygenase SsuD/methylene tetrahydromethanopterin reductase-like flavin-dependent oxidoreductase (luciferase family)